MIYKKTKIICLLIYFFHLSISHFILPRLHRSDIYPFYNWNLFSFAPLIQGKYFIRVYEVNGREIRPPHLVFKNRKLYPGISLYYAPSQISRFATYIERSPLDHRGMKYKKEMETTLFSSYDSVIYEIAFAHVNIRELLKKDQIDNYISLGKFTYRKQE